MRSQVRSRAQGCCHARSVWSDVLHCTQTSILTNIHPEKIDIADVPVVALQLLAKGNVRLRQAQNTADQRSPQALAREQISF